MCSAPIIGVLTPEVTDFRSRQDFFVRILASVRAATEARGGQTLVVLGKGQQLAWNQVDGWIVIADLAGAVELQQANKSVVTLNVYRPDLGIPAVLPDNQAGTRAAVRHLIGHGHTRIAFVGARRYFDIEQRYQAYVDALAGQGIALDPRLVIDPEENDIKATRRACAGLLPGLPCTVVICGTDAHAMGVLELVQAAGVRVPEELAIVGFDDVAQAQYLRPSLTTVRQDVEALGRMSVEVLCDQLAGGTPPAVTMVPTQLILRRSCGCRLIAEVDAAARPVRRPVQSWQEQLTRAVVDLVQVVAHPAGARSASRVWAGSATIVRAVEAALHGSTLPHPTDLEQACDALVEQIDHLGQLDLLMALVEQASQQELAARLADVDAPPRLQRVLRHIRLELTRAYQLVEQREHTWLVHLLHLTHHISTTLFGDDPHQAQQLAWLHDTPALMACLGVWADRNGRATPELIVASAYARDACATAQLGSRYAAADFPPLGFRPRSSGLPASFSIVIPLKTPHRNWGVLHLWPLADAPYFVYVLWARLLSSALERASLLKLVDRLVTSPDQLASVDVAIGYGDASERVTPQHAEVQLTFVEQGAITYLLGGRQATLMAGHVGLFWAAMPHHIVWIDPATTYCWLRIPLAWVLQHHLPDTLMQPLLYGGLVVDQDQTSAGIDAAAFRRWDAEVHLHGAEGQKIALLEIEARLRRLTRSASVATALDRVSEEQSRLVHRNAARKAEQIAQFIADHYTEAVRIHDIARAVGLNASYTITLFRTTTGMSPAVYLTRYRIAHAQRLLATTDTPVAQIALDSGFSSISQFYAVFKRACKQSPNMYRASPRAFK